MSEQRSEKYLRVRKFRLVLPVIIVPIILIFFWLMGGGKAGEAVLAKRGGLNTSLPVAQTVKDSAKDKLAFYVAADADSSKRLEQLRMDPYRKDTVVTKMSPVVNEYSPVRRVYAENNDLQARIASIQRQVTARETVTEERKTVAAAGAQPDPEMEAINTTLDKLMAIQHPESVEPKNNHYSTPKGLAVNIGETNDDTYFGKQRKAGGSAFYSDTYVVKQGATLTAVISSIQQVHSGSTVKFELSQAISVGGVRIRAGVAVYGIAQIEGDRMRVPITSIQYEDQLIPVSLSVYDLDGLEGIHVSVPVTRDAVKDAADNIIPSSVGSGFSGTITTQAVSAGIGAAKGLLSKKMKQVTVTISSCKVLLRDKNSSGY